MLLLAEPAVANLREALDEINGILARGERVAPSEARRLLMLFRHALSLRTEAFRLRSGPATYSSAGVWEPASPSGTVWEG